MLSPRSLTGETGESRLGGEPFDSSRLFPSQHPGETRFPEDVPSQNSRPLNSFNSMTLVPGAKRPYDDFPEVIDDDAVASRSISSPTNPFERLEKMWGSTSRIRSDERYSFRTALPAKHSIQRFTPSKSPLNLSGSPSKALTAPSGTKRSTRRQNKTKTRIAVLSKSKIDQSLYRCWRDGNTGLVLKTWGALIPETYRKSDDAQFPWICPVRSCRIMFESVTSLGTHFVNSHRATKLNDNLDGTLTDLGKYASQVNGKVGRKDGVSQPGVVVSRKRLSRQLYPLTDPTRYSKSQTSGPISITETTSSSSRLAIEYATPERPYNMWPDESRRLERMQGALLPEGYQQDFALPGRPWVCPIRSCRCLFTALSELDNHFKNRHRGSRLNDNLDGTFSLIPQTDNSNRLESLNCRDQPAIVVSRSQLHAAVDKHQASPPLIRLPLKPVTPCKGDPAALWVYICSCFNGIFIDPDIKMKPTIRHLLGLPRVRDLPHDVVSMDRLTDQQVAALLIQVTGQLVENRCSRCRRGDSPFGLCVHYVVAGVQHRTTESAKRPATCAGCLFSGVGGLCSIKILKEPEAQREIGAPEVGFLTDSPELLFDPTSHRRSRRLSLLQEEPVSDRRSPRVTATLPKTPKSQVKQKKVAGKLKTPTKKAAFTPATKKTPKRKARNSSPFEGLSPTPTHRSGVLPRRILTAKPPPRFNLNSPVVSQPLPICNPGEIELERWEHRAGSGQVTSARGTNSMTLAYAGSHLSTSSNHELKQVTPNISVTAIRINSGTPHYFPAEENTTRICTVANGKLRVKVDDEDEYAIGAKGVFKIDAGLGCRVFNRCYEDVVLHVSGFSTL